MKTHVFLISALLFALLPYELFGIQTSAQFPLVSSTISLLRIDASSASGNSGMIKKKIVKKLNSSPGASVKQQKPNQQQTQKNIQKQNAPVQKNNSQAEGKYASMTQEEYLELQRHAREMEMKIWCTEAYGVALTLKTYFKDRKPIVLGWMPEPNSGKNGAYLTEAYMRTLRASGFPEMRYIAIDNFPPIGVSQSDQVKKIVNALRKVGNADLIIYRNAPIPGAYFESGYAENGYKFFTTNELQNEQLWKIGVIQANLVTKKGVSPETYPDDMKKALLKGFVLRVNQDILESVQKKSSEDSDDVESE